MENATEDEPSVHELVELGSALILSIMRKAPRSEIDQLIERGAPMWFQDEEGHSALHAACFVEDSALAQLLIDRHAVWNAGTTASPYHTPTRGTDIYIT